MESYETLTAHFYDRNIFREMQKLFRFFNGNSRYYFSASNPKPCIGITSYLANTVKMPQQLEQWMFEKGKVESDNIKFERADYGSIMHDTFASILKNLTLNGKVDIDLENFRKELTPYSNEILNKYHPLRQYQFLDELKSDTCAFINFIVSNNVKAILCETSLQSTTMQLALTLDLFCTMDYEIKGFFGETYKTGQNAGQPKESKKLERIYAIIDFKSVIKKEQDEDTIQHNKAIGLTNKLQLNFQRYILKENFPEFKNTEIKCFNFIPKNWRGVNPTYQLTEATDFSDECLIADYQRNVEFYPNLFNIEDKKFTVISGFCENNIQNNIHEVTIKEKINSILMQNFD